MNNRLHPQLPRTQAQWPVCSVLSSHPWVPIRYSPKSYVTLNPSWATPAARPSSLDHGSLPKEKGQGEMCLGGVQQGRVVGSKHRAQLCSQGAPERPGYVASSGQKELSVGCFFLAGSTQCSTMCIREERQCKDRGGGISGAKS